MSTLKCLHDSKCFKYHLRASLPAVVAPPATQHHRTRGPLCRIKNMSRVRPATRQRKRASAKSSRCDKQKHSTHRTRTHTHTHTQKKGGKSHTQTVCATLAHRDTQQTTQQKPAEPTVENKGVFSSVFMWGGLFFVSSECVESVPRGDFIGMEGLSCR
jgi:hypothetical protein